MTALGEPSPRAETDKEKDGKQHWPAAEPISAATIGNLVLAGSPKPRGLGGMITQLFRDAKNVLTANDAPAPEAKRKRREETGRDFRMTARKLVRRAVRVPAEAYVKATAYLADTLDWLNQWHDQDDIAEDVQPAPSEHLYPHL